LESLPEDEWRRLEAESEQLVKANSLFIHRVAEEAASRLIADHGEIKISKAKMLQILDSLT